MKRVRSSRMALQLGGPVTVLNIGRVNNDAQQEAKSVDQDVPLTTDDLLVRA